MAGTIGLGGITATGASTRPGITVTVIGTIGTTAGYAGDAMYPYGWWGGGILGTVLLIVLILMLLGYR